MNIDVCNNNIPFPRGYRLYNLLPSGIYKPYEFEPPPSGDSEITHKDAPKTVGLLWMSDQPVAETST
jgi:hypothetical protein